VFTRSKCPSAPVDWCRAKLKPGRARALVVNSGNANAFTGKAGREATKLTAEIAAEVAECRPGEVFLASTGVIGEPLDARKFSRVMDQLVQQAAPGQWEAAAKAIMTTDTFPKGAAAVTRIGGAPVTICGIAKGAGMIAPDMATLLVCVVTDACVPAPALRRFLRAGVATSFNAITVDGDTSTNDTALVLANGRAGNPPLALASRDGARFGAALAEVMAELAEMVVADGEGATRRARITVTGASSERAARRAARAIAESQLVKTALFGGDPNWGRIVCAAGYAGVALAPERVGVRIGGVPVLRRGEPAPESAVTRAATLMRQAAVDIEVDLATGGRGTATIATSDLSSAYVRFNSAYST